MRKVLKYSTTTSILFLTIGCGAFKEIKEVPYKIRQPIKDDVMLSALWVGHATVLLQIRDKVIITDPIFSNRINIVKRKVEPGLYPSDIPRIDAIIISHPHLDHLDFKSLRELESIAYLFLPNGAKAYLPKLNIGKIIELSKWEYFEIDGLKITAVPIKHFGGRYGIDGLWNDSYTGYIIEYGEITILFLGDTAYDEKMFKLIGERFQIDLALIPIAPCKPNFLAKIFHLNPKDAVRAFENLKAKYMIPIHYGTFDLGMESLDVPEKKLRKIIQEKHYEDMIFILKHGEQKIFEQGIIFRKTKGGYKILNSSIVSCQ